MFKIIVFFFVFTLSACQKNEPEKAADHSELSSEPVTAGGTPSPYQTEAEAEAAVQKALLGDPDAAWGLSLYFHERGDAVRKEYWERSAVLNLSGSAFDVIGGGLLYSDDPCSKMRGIYLIELGSRVLPPGKRHFMDRWMPEVARAKESVNAAGDKHCLEATPE
jgi:hypothetical protein